MGVFGEKHTSLTREQKRQLIHQADTHKLRPTEVCDWVLATWGLRIARVTVYSILHKQRASLMAGHKDLYQSMQNSINGLQQSAPASSTNTYNSDEACLERNKATGRISKPTSTSRSADKHARSTSSGLRDSSVASDLSSTVPVSYEAPTGEGARWEGQLKRVREPASVELDRAMVEFLKSSEAVDAHGRRLNDAELQSHALRLARGIPSAARMRCSFGWLRHFKRRLGVQWAADRLGRYRWIIEMDPLGSHASPFSTTSLTSKTSSTDHPAGAADAHRAPLQHHNFGQQQHPAPQPRQGRVKQNHRKSSHSSSQAHEGSRLPQISVVDDEEVEEEEEDEVYHSSNELFGKDFDLTSRIPSATHDLVNGLPQSSSKHARSSSTSTTSTTSTSISSSSPYATSYASSYSSFANQLQAMASRTLYPFSEASSPYASLGPFSILSSATPSSSLSVPSQPLAHYHHHQPLPTSSLAHPSHSAFFNLGPSSLTQHHSQQQQQQQPQSPSILDSLPSLFDSLPPLSSASQHRGISAVTGSNNNSNNNSLTSPQLVLNHTSATIDHGRDNFYSQQQQQQQQQSSTPLSPMGGASNSPFGMGVDGGMRKVPSKDEAYDMLQSLLLYYEQDHHFLGEQQTLLLPRWIHQHRQIMNQSDENDVRMLWMRHQQFQQQQQRQQQQQQQQQQQTLSHPHSNYPRSTISSPPMSPTTTNVSDSTSSSVKLTTSVGTSTSLDREEVASASVSISNSSSAGLDHQYGALTSNTNSSNSAVPSMVSSIEQQMLFAHQQQLQQQYALHQQHQQQQQQQQSSFLLQRPSSSQ